MRSMVQRNVIAGVGGRRDRRRAAAGRPRRAGVVASVGIAALLASCSSGGPSASSAAAGGGAGSSSSSGPAPTTTVPVERFTGSIDDFYQAPKPLPSGLPGSLIRTMPVDAPAGQAGLRIMYHSTDDAGHDRPVTGLVYWPTDPAPAGGWPVLAWDHGTTGLAAKCAPSRKASPPPAFGTQGVRVATDYIGLGPVGEVHPYLSAAAEGNATIDSVVAARSIPDAHAGDRWVVAGVSQGGHAALVTGEKAAERLPSAHLLGTVAIAPGSQLGETYGDDLQARVITGMVLVGVAADRPDVDVRDYIAERGWPIATAMKEGCVSDVLGSAAVAASPEFFVKDPRTSDVGKAWVQKNDPGQVKSPSPLLLVQGGKDILVLPPRTAALFARECGLGQVVHQIAIPDGNHDTVTNLAKDQISTWIAARFAGEAPTNDC